MSNYMKLLDSLFPDERRGDWWTVSRALELTLRDKLLTLAKTQDIDTISTARPLEFAAAYLDPSNGPHILGDVILFYKGRAFLGSRLAQRYNVRGDIKMAATAAAWSEEISSQIAGKIRVSWRFDTADHLDDWLVRTITRDADEIMRSVRRRLTLVNMEGKRGA